ncbi:MAG TPA: BON domain-containing protein [Caldilineaceae bacterium]|nr:BON domain-containing protein [Caldilineaceae bacterium]
MFEAQLATKMKALSASDQILAGQINDALQMNKYLHLAGAGGIEIQVKDGVVTLSGHVGMTMNIIDVDYAVHSVLGVVRVENHLVADDKLMMAVARALGNDDRMHHEQMGVNAQRGFIYLTGQASSAAIRLLAAQIAAGLPQVRGIVNRIQAPDVVLDDAEEDLIQPAIDQAVYAADGELGHVHKLIVNPHSRRVSAAVVDTRDVDIPRIASVLLSNTHLPQERQLLIPSDALRCAASGAIFLKLRLKQPVNFINFNPNNFVVPPADWHPPYPYQPGDVLFSRQRV